MIDWSLVRYGIPLVLFCCLRDNGWEFFLFLFFSWITLLDVINTLNLAISFPDVFAAFYYGWVSV